MNHKARRSNILFIMTDQQRFDTFTCVNPAIITPNIDTLLHDSIYFANAYCTSPSCISSRASIMTGKYPSECRVPTFITKLPADEVTFMSRLQDLGYYTAAIGKQHFAGSKVHRGYDYENIIDGHSPDAEPETIQAYLEYLKSNQVDISSMTEKNPGELISGCKWLAETKYHLDYFIGELGKEWLKERVSSDSGQPWFLNLSFPGPHHPYDCEGTEYAELYPLDSIPLPETSFKDLNNRPRHYRKMGGYSQIYLKDYSRKAFLRTKRAYYANITLIDQEIGEVVKTLKDTGVYDNTTIIFTSDHGDFMGHLGMVEKLQCLTESLMRIPLFVKPPIANFNGKVVNDLVSNIDIASTCLQIAGSNIPDNISDFPYSMYWNDGKDIKVREHIYMEAGGIRGILKDGVKVVHYINRDYGEIYNIDIDSQECCNLWDNSKYDCYKMEAYRLLLSSMNRAVPLSDTEWNHGTPLY